MESEGKWLHFGMTSSDVIDTALSLTIQKAGSLVLDDIDLVLKSLKKLAEKHKHLPCIGRSHGIHGEPTSFGLRFLSYWSEIHRQKLRFQEALEDCRVGQFSGAMGNFSSLQPDWEQRACEKLGLRAEPVSTQIIPRDRHAQIFWCLASLGTSMERIATELRHLQRTEVLEVEEGFSKGQKGSSAMPHKKNPISAENITGCARLLRSTLHSCLENVVTWHERDISHSSVERVQFPDSFILVDYTLHRLHRLLEGLEVKEDAIRKNLNHLNGLPLSGIVLLDLVKAGFSREKAYELIQKIAHKSWSENLDFLSELEKDTEAKKFLGTDLHKSYGEEKFLKHVDQIFERSFKSSN
jgi:adenylosuccinate lyase